MSRSHSIWTDIDNNSYRTSKSFGGEYDSKTYVGSSASYSELFFTQIVDSDQLGNIRMFRLYIDNKLIKTKHFNVKTKEFYKDINEVPLTEVKFWEYNKREDGF